MLDSSMWTGKWLGVKGDSEKERNPDTPETNVVPENPIGWWRTCRVDDTSSETHRKPHANMRQTVIVLALPVVVVFGPLVWITRACDHMAGKAGA